MNNERLLINYVNNIYKEFEQQGWELSNKEKMIFETGIAQGITFTLTNLIKTDIDLKVLGQYSPEDI